MMINFENIGAFLLAAGALGTAAFGIVEALKWSRLGEMGFRKLKAFFVTIEAALRAAYGENYEEMLRSQYRGERDQLALTLRQGVRIGLSPDTATSLAEAINVVEAAELVAAAQLVQLQNDVTPDQEKKLRNVLGRFEVAADAKIDAALTLALDHYASGMRFAASGVAMGIALLGGVLVAWQDNNMLVIFSSILLGLAAVPIAPIAKDLVSALQSASAALRGNP